MKPLARIIVFLLAATSIWCLLGEMYHLWPMRWFTLAVFAPACVALVAIAIHDGLRGNGRACRIILIGAVAGFLAAVAYDIFRLPFVFSKSWGLAGMIPPLPLFKVFPMFGAMIIGTSDSSSLAANLVGWLYHFSNGVTFGVMYAAMVNGQWRRLWPVAVVFAVGLELAMLFTPYPATFGIRVTETFVIVTLTAHLIFGVTMGRTSIFLGLMSSGNFISTGLQPGELRRKENPAASAASGLVEKPLKRLASPTHTDTGLKPGANEKSEEPPEC